MLKWSKRAISTTNLSTTSNGIRVVTDSVPGHFSALGIYVNAGSRYESALQLEGCSHLLDRLAFKSTAKYPGQEMLKQLNHLGGNFMCASARESLMYQASVFNPDVEQMFSLISETVARPQLTEKELSEQKQTAEYELNEIWMQSDLILPELFQQTAYNKQNLGSPLLCPLEQLSKISLDEIHRYRDLFYRPDNLVVAMLGIPHERSLELVDKYLGSMPSSSSPKPEMEPSKYTGGVLTVPPPPPFGGLPEFHHIYVGFEGVSITSEDIYALATLQILVGSGGSFSAGGPGKGMYSRAYTRVLNQYGFVESCKSFIHNFTDSGLFGISISCIPQANHVIPELLAQEFSALMKRSGKASITQEEVDRAKNQLKSSLLMNLESKMVQLEDLGRQIQVYGRKVDVDEMCQKIDMLSRNDIIDIAEKVLTGSKPTVVIQGDGESFGDVAKLLESYGLAKY